MYENMLRNINRRKMNLVNSRDTWAEKELLKVKFSIIEDIIDGYKNTLLRGPNPNK